MWVVAVFLAILSALLQSTFLPTVKIFAGLVELDIIVLLIFLFFGSLREASVFLFIFAIFSAIFSQIPAVYFLLPDFIVIVIFVLLSRLRIIIRPGTLFSFPLFFLAVVIADLVKLAVLLKFSFYNLSIILADALLTAFVATIIYWAVNKIYHFLNPQITREKIKLVE